MANNVVFLCHTPYQVYISSLIVGEFFPSDNTILVVEGIHRSRREVVFKDIVRLDPIGGSVVGVRAQIERAAKIIDSLVDSKNRNIFFLSDAAWPLCNRVFFKKAYNSFEFNFFSDGLGSYVNRERSWFEKIKDYVKFITGFLGFTSKYTPLNAHPFGYDNRRAKSLFVPSPESVKYNGIDLVKVGFPYKQKNKSCRKLLFLEQPLWIIMGEGWHPFLSRSLNYVKEKYPDYELHFKMHHRGRDSDRSVFKNNGFNELDSKICVEEIVADDSYDVVVSYFSSALPHLYWLSREEIELISICSSEFRKLNGYSQLNDLLEETRVKKVSL